MRCLDEATFMEVMLGGLPPARVAELDAHLDTCPSCRRLMAQALQARTSEPVDAADSLASTGPSSSSAVEAAPLARGTAVGRYLVLERLGAGGMGVVYAAYDPELDRRVALKLLRTRGLGLELEAGRALLLREAQAMARVSHPHVVPIYDVGTFGEQVFLAMELVEAQTLRQWLLVAPRSWREVRDAFVQAGRGLAAAHAAGLVHGDVKPENLLVGRDGRVRVTDFGLARTATSGGGEVPRLVGGTPAYMAPEQLAGDGQVDARSDQFSLCVALYEALHGERPFQGATVDALSLEVRAGRVRPAPRGSSVPAWLHRAVLRGLEVEPSRRHASLEALLAALLADPGARRRRWLAWAGGMALVLGAVVATHALHAHQARACAGAAERAMASVWGTPHQRAVEAAFLGTERPFATAAWAQVRRSLNAYTSAWVTTRTAACEATRVRGEQSEEVLGKRMRCLDGRLAEVAALTQVLAQADADVVGRALRAVESLPAPSGCSDSATLARGAEPSEALRAALVRARALEAAGRYAEGLSVALPAAESARKEGDRAGSAEGLLAVAELREQAGDYRGAEEALFESLWAAEAVGHDRVAARGWTLAVRLTGERFEQFALARRWRERADAALLRLGGDDGLRARLHVNVGRVLYVQGHYAEAEAQHRQALELLERTVGPESLAVSEVLLKRCAAWTSLGRTEEALELGHRALALREHALGPEHPEVGMALAELAEVRWYRSEFAEAERLSLRSIEVLERALGPEHPGLVSALNTLATTRIPLGWKPVELLPMLERALRLMEASGGADSSDSAVLTHNIAATMARAGRVQEAGRLLAEATARLERKLGREHPTLVVMLISLADVHRMQGKLAEALPHYERAAAIQDSLVEDRQNLWGQTLLNLGRVYVDLGRPGDAVAPLSRLLAGRERTHVSPMVGAVGRFFLARALWDSGGDRQRALQLATEARTLVDDQDPSAPRFRKDLEAWLARHER
ncbi:serine/threonine-protein kinase [Hyalangium rubrum]|uniref:Serine/threonine-protein kinase n=1 Tax=Hyalangium rubrum TaxID=3103134 RepID=A0ABU5HF65_9BACT|nr:serine/threonine-protein kinase [Hyalangium sp. s54d21]MDY7231774.1 serine/threonine-protein kinase [Hyalangium sp. s54d21]